MPPPNLEPAQTAQVPLPPLEYAEAERISDLTPKQWRSGIAAWLGWLFDGLEMQLFTLVAAPFVAQLLNSIPSDPNVKTKMAWIQGAFLIGWALGGGFFGRAGDILGRSKTLALTIFVYAIFTGLSCIATSWWELMIFRFISALGIGGEWALGASLLAETWPRKWRVWVAAVLQTAVNIGILFACVWVYFLTGVSEKYNFHPERWAFLIGVLPAGAVFWIRLSVEEPPEWHLAKKTDTQPPKWIHLFQGDVRRITIYSTIVCACSLTTWWAFMFWHVQHLRNILHDAGWNSADTQRLITVEFFLLIGVSIFGNFFCGWLAKIFGYRDAIALVFIGFFISIAGTYIVPRDYKSILMWIPWIGFFSGVFGLFTMYMPPLFPVLLRTTGAGFCYNIGRLAAAFGTIFFAYFSVSDLRPVLLGDAFLLIPAIIFTRWLPDLRDNSAPLDAIKTEETQRHRGAETDAERLRASL
jgi:MFS family permease